MKSLCGFLMTLSLAGLLGCGDSEKAQAEKVAAAARQSFDTAPETLKTKFQELTTAVAASDFPKAKASLDQLKQAQLSPEQQMAVAEQEQALMLKAATASQNGDAEAFKLLQAVRSERRSR
jgi:hypothetical protein